MKIKQLEKLQDLIDADFAWRKKELVSIKLMINASENPILCRMGIAMLSAHFEGFLKQIANYYVVYVASQNISLSQLKTNFLAIHSSSVFRGCENTDKVSVYQRAMEDFLSNYNTKRFQVKYSHDKPIIKTESNPSSAVVKDIFDSIGLDFAPYETKRNYIDSDLLSNRHAVVHGEKIEISVEDFNDTFKHILEIMEQFSRQIIQAAVDKTYLK